MDTRGDQPLLRPRPRKRDRSRRGFRTIALFAAPILLTAVAVTVVSTSGADATDRNVLAGAVTSNGIRLAGSAAPSSLVAGSRVTLAATVRSTTTRTVVVDIEVYAPDGTRAGQRFWTGRKLIAGKTRTFATTVQLPARTDGSYRVKVGVFTKGWKTLLAWHDNAARFTVLPASSPIPTATATSVTPPAATTPTATAPASTTPAPVSTPSTPSTTNTGSGQAPTHFGLIAPGGTLPSSAQCAAWVRSVPVPAEIRAVNSTANQTPGHLIAGATGLRARVDGAFTGTTEQILRWTACKWGVDEDFVKAQAVAESWWTMDAKGDWGTDATRCAPGHGLGADGKAGSCPESWGLLQVRYPYNQDAFPDALRSSAFNADWAYSSWRSCYTGELTWLNGVERGSQYAAGDAWGCAGVWFSGRWHTASAEDYITKVKANLSQRIWETANFRGA